MAIDGQATVAGARRGPHAAPDGSGNGAPGAAGTLAAGFATPALDAQATFRSVLDAMAHPGSIRLPPPGLPEPPAPLLAPAYALALTLFDLETPVWLDAPLQDPGVVDTLRFHCGCPIVDHPADARFALVGEPARMPPLDAFDPGTPEYPDRSATLILQVAHLGDDAGPTLTGPGILERAQLRIEGVGPAFWSAWAANHEGFPLGVDLMLVTGDRLAALPRSTRVAI
jgi:alpha-D-ribose 1-methylphosphonate 5-triphosphate synthase subunit PhnH